MFILNAATNNWELAGINLAADGPFSTSSNGTNPFDASMFDTTGLFVPDAVGGWVAAPNPSAFYATEIAAHRGFIQSVIMQLAGVVSRKTHGNAGTFDVDLPQTSAPGIECRSGGINKEYTLVFVFANNVTVQSATVASGVGSVNTFSVNQNTVTANLSGVTTGQTIVVKLVGVSDGLNTSDVQATMGVLVGDTTVNGKVNASDIAQVQSQSGHLVTSENFREDVTVNGTINSSDIALVQSQSGMGLPDTNAQTTAETSAPNLSIKPLPLSKRNQPAFSVPPRSYNRQR